MPFVRQLMRPGEGPISYRDPLDGRVYTGDYIRLNKVLLVYLRCEGHPQTSKARRRSSSAPGQGELFS